MEAKTVRPQAKSIQGRFFEAINTLIASGKLEGMKTFRNLYDLHQPKYSRLRSATMDITKECPYKLIDIDAPAYLAKDFGVSSDWLLLGRGKMFKQLDYEH